MSLAQEEIQKLMKLMMKRHEKQILEHLKNSMLYGRSMGKSELRNQQLQLFAENVGVDMAVVGSDRSVIHIDSLAPMIKQNPQFMILDEWSDVLQYKYDIDPGYVPDKDGPTSRYWTQPIPDPQAPKPVSSPSSTKRAKLRAKRKKRK